MRLPWQRAREPRNCLTQMAPLTQEIAPSHKVIVTPVAPSNPYQSLLANALREQGIVSIPASPLWFAVKAITRGAGIVHIHWLHRFYSGRTPLIVGAKLLVFLLQWHLIRVFKIRIVWTMHNLASHDTHFRLGDKLLMRLVASAAHVVITHCNSARLLLMHQLPEIDSRKILVIPHGHFCGVYGPILDGDLWRVRQALGLPADGFIIAFIGNIRRYKGVPQLIRAFSSSLISSRAYLLIAGHVQEVAFEREIVGLVEDQTNIILRRGFLPNTEILQYLASCNVIVVPYTDILTSGSAILALSYGKPLIAPKIGCLADLAKEACGIFYDPNDLVSLTQALEVAYASRRLLPAWGDRNRATAQSLDWSTIAGATANAYFRAAPPFNNTPG